MDELTSTEFRKVYASLREPVVVTVNGHPIGTWTPAATAMLTEAKPVDASQLASFERLLRGEGPGR